MVNMRFAANVLTNNGGIEMYVNSLNLGLAARSAAFRQNVEKNFFALFLGHDKRDDMDTHSDGRGVLPLSPLP